MLLQCYCYVNVTFISRMNKMLPTFPKSSSACSLMIVASMHSMLPLQLRNNLYKKN